MLSPWADVLQTARTICTKLNTQASTRSTQCAHSVRPAASSHIPDLHLPTELELFPEELHPVHPRLLATVSRATAKLRDSCQTKYHETCRSLITFDEPSGLRPLHEYQEAFQKGLYHLYLKQIKSWVDNVVKANASICNSIAKQPNSCTVERETEKKTAFKHECLPRLELCFSKCQYPTHADKELLAKKTGMSYKQIHVWFQNRRSRTKKNNALSTDNQAAASLSSASVLEAAAFVGHNPPYVFPSTYPPKFVLEVDPFPCRAGDFSSFEAPHWRRQPALSPNPQKLTGMDVSTLCLAFASLSLDDSAERLWKQTAHCGVTLHRPSKETNQGVAWPFVVRPLRAPLSSLIKDFVPCVGCRSKTSKHSKGPETTTPASADESITEPDTRRKRRRRVPASREAKCSTANKNSSLSPHVSLSEAIALLSAGDPAARILPLRPRVKKVKRVTQHDEAILPVQRKTNCIIPEAVATEHLSEPPYPRRSPAASTDSLPSLTYSSAGSSASTCSQSPTLSLATLSDDEHCLSSDSLDNRACEFSSSLSLSCTLPNKLPPLSFTSNISLDFTKSSSDQLFSLDLPAYPSYTESLDLISQGLQSSPDFPPPSLTFDLPSLAM